MPHIYAEGTRTLRGLLIIGAAIAAAACSDRNPVGPTGAVRQTQAAEPFAATIPAVVRTGGGEFVDLAVRADGQSESPAIERGPEHIEHPVRFPLWQGLVVFPPRNEPNTFFADLQRLYRDELRRPQSAISYVDPEGQNVWLTEYFRFWLNGCSHEEASSRTLQEIATGATLPTCGAERFDFPPRNLPNEFQGRLEAAYRDVLRRPQMLSYLDSEGANVWLAQYLRFRTSGGCGHAEAQAKVFTEVRGGGVQPTCNAEIQTWTGSFTASGTFQLSTSCVWSYVEEFSNVRLVLRPDGTGTLTALVRTTEGPRVEGPASCPDNTFTRQQNDVFQLRSTPVAGGWQFELVPQPGAIRSLQGTATVTGATGTYSLRSGALGAGGVRQTSATFTLTPAR